MGLVPWGPTVIRRIFAAQFVCPCCEREHYLEAEEAIEVLPPDRVGMAALCGSCEAMRRCWYVGEGKTRPFWDDTSEARVWLNIRRFPDRYQMQAWETDPHDQALRNDREEKLLALIGVAPSKPGYPIRYKMRWSLEDMRAKGIDWPIPENPKPF